MPKTGLDLRHTTAVKTADEAALLAVVDAKGGAHALLDEAIGAIRHHMLNPVGRNGPATAVTAARLIIETVVKALGAKGNDHGERAPLVNLTLMASPASIVPSAQTGGEVWSDHELNVGKGNERVA